MKKIIKKMILMIGCVGLAIFALTGCGNVESGKPVHAALILQPISTAPVVNVEAARDLLETVCREPGCTLSIIVADGQPWEYMTVEPDDIDKSLSSDMRNQILEERIRDLVTAATSAEAANPETDLRTAVEMGARQLHAYSDDARLEMVICGPFENTVAPIRMQDMTLSYMDIESTIDNLSDNGHVVDLKKISITGYNLGDTCEPQKKLSDKDKASLRAFWTAFFEAGNAEKVEFMSDLPSGATYEDAPETSTIPVVETGSALEALEKDMADAITFDETVIEFKKNTAELIHEDAARKKVSAVAKCMAKNHKMQAILVGSTAKWGALKDSIRLSFERAKVVKKLLVDAGVPEGNITVVGSGWLSCFYVNDQTQDGALNEDYAHLNRACTWVNRNSDLAEQIFNDPDYERFIVE